MRRVPGGALNSVLGRLDQHRRLRSSDHGVEVRSRRHHGIDAVFLFNAEVDEHRALGLPRLLHQALQVRPPFDTKAQQPVGVGELHEVGTSQWRGRIASFLEELLPLTDHTQIPVVDDGDVHLHAFLCCGAQLGLCHLEAAVADDGPDFSVRACDLRTDCRR